MLFLHAQNAAQLIMTFYALYFSADAVYYLTLVAGVSCAAKHELFAMIQIYNKILKDRIIRDQQSTMQGFSKDMVARNRVGLIKNRYDKQVDETKDKVIKMQSISVTQYSTSKQALQYYYRGAILIGLGILTSAISYPLSVRIVKKLFNLKQFINIHLAAIPIIVNINAFVLGVAQGYINYYLLMRKYPGRYKLESTMDLL